jgi:hypothetical protein
MSDAVQVQQVRVTKAAEIAPGDVLLVHAGEVVGHIAKAAASNGHAVPLPLPAPKPEPELEFDQPSALRAFEQATANGGAGPRYPTRDDVLREIGKYPAGLQARRVFEIFDIPPDSPDRARISTMLHACCADEQLVKRPHKTGKEKRPAYVLVPGALKQ